MGKYYTEEGNMGQKKEKHLLLLLVAEA